METITRSDQIAPAPTPAPNFNDFNQDRYLTSVETRLCLALVITDYRPEAIRVTERIAQPSRDTWFEVEIFSPRSGMWIQMKTHPIEAVAIKDAGDWYPADKRDAPSSQ